MIETKFIPGPWTFDIDSVRMYDEGDKRFMVNLFTGVMNVTEEQQKATNRLIAAAPEMFDKLYKSAKLLDQKGYSMFAKEINDLLNKIIEGGN